MSTKLATILADFTTNLASAITVAGTTATLQSATDDDGIALPSGTYFFTLDGENSSKEHIVCTLSGTSLTAISSVSRQGVEASGAVRSHRIGATVSLTDFGHILFMNNLLRGVTTFDASAPLGYDGTASITTANQFATKAYVDGVAVSGAPNADLTTKGIVQLATQAQVDAGTATGSTAASIVATPATTRSRLLSDYVADTGAADAYVITPSPAITAYAVGQRFSFKAANTNTTVATLAVSGLAAKSIKKYGSIALIAGDIVAGQICEVEYDGTNLQLLGYSGAPRQSQGGAENYVVDGGSANAYTGTLVPAITAYTAGLRVFVKISNTSTAASTLNLNGLGVKTIKKLNGSTDITKGDLVSGSTYTFVYDGTNFVTQVAVQSANGTLSIAANSGTNTVTTAFKPRKIRMWWIYNVQVAGANFAAYGFGTYVAGTSAEVFSQSPNAGNSASVATTVTADGTRIMSGQENSSASGSFTGTIGNLTDTGFDLTMANATSASPTVKIMWEAES